MGLVLELGLVGVVFGFLCVHVCVCVCACSLCYLDRQTMLTKINNNEMTHNKKKYIDITVTCAQYVESKYPH